MTNNCNVCNNHSKLISFSLSAIFFACMSQLAIGQDSTLLQPRWEVGVDLLSPFKPIRLDELNSTYGLIIKRSFEPKNALRFRSNFGYDYMPDPPVKGFNQPRSYSLSFDLGYEKRRQHKRFVHYYGADLIFRLHRLENVIGLGISPGTGTTFTRDRGRINSLGIAAFTGGKYFIAERISLSLETNIHLVYGKIVYTNSQVNTAGQVVSPSVVTTSTNGIEFKVSPISVIYLSYYF